MNYFKKEQLCVFNYLADTVEKLYQTGNSRESAAILQLFEGWVCQPRRRMAYVWLFEGSWRIQWLSTANIENRTSSPILT